MRMSSGSRLVTLLIVRVRVLMCVLVMRHGRLKGM